MKRGIGLAARFIVLAFVLFATRSILAESKPVAIWCGDFATGTEGARGGYVINPNGNTLSSDYIILDGTGGGVIVTNNTFATQNQSSHLVAIAGLEGIQYTKNRTSVEALISTYDKQAANNYSWFAFHSGVSDYRLYCMYNSTPTDWGKGFTNVASPAWPSDGRIHYIAATFATPVTTTKGWRSYIDGNLSSYTDNTCSTEGDKTRYLYGVTIGGGTSGNRLMNNESSNAKIKYVAILRGTANTEIDAKYWSLTGMTKIASVLSSSDANTGVSLAVSDTLSSTVEAAAVFVQKANSKLTISNGATLTIGGGAGPLYIADGASFTVDASACSVGASGVQPLIRGRIFGDIDLENSTLPSSPNTLRFDKTDTGLYLIDESSEVDFKSYSVNFYHDNNSKLLTLSGILGIEEVPRAYWNNVLGGTGTTTGLVCLNRSSTYAPIDSSISLTVSNVQGSYNAIRYDAYDLRRGFVHDHNSSYATPTVTISNVPFDAYRVIVYHSTDSLNSAAYSQFGYDKINDKNFTYAGGVLDYGTTAWGDVDANPPALSLEEGKNILFSDVVSGSTLTVVSHRSETAPKTRAGIAAIQIIKAYPTTLLNADNVFGAIFPDAASDGDYVVNVTSDSPATSTLAINSAITVRSLTFNIAEGKTLVFSGASNLTASKVIVNGPGKLKLNATGTLASLSVAENAELGFGDGAALTVTGALRVYSGKTLTLVPDSISGASNVFLTVGSKSGTINCTQPTEEGYSYAFINDATTFKLVRTPTPAFVYDGKPGAANPSGWGISSWSYNNTMNNLRVGPNENYPIVAEVNSSWHPGSSVTLGDSASAFTFSVYADVSQLPSSENNYVIAAIGKGVTTGDKKFVVLYRRGDYVRLGNLSGDSWVGGSTCEIPVASGYHLWTATCKSDGTIHLYRDTGSGVSEHDSKAIGSLEIAASDPGLQIGSVWGTNENFSQGDGLAFAAIRGYDAVLEADNVAKLAESFPATDGATIDFDVKLNKANSTLTAYTISDEDADTTFGVDAGNIVIPANNTVSIAKFHTYTSGSEDGAANTVTINGKLEVKQTDTTIGDDAGKGVVIGYWLKADSGTRTSTVTVPAGGELDASNAYILMPYNAKVQGASLNITGGTVKAKGLYSNSDASVSGIVTLSSGGILEVADIQSGGKAVTKNFGKGTFRVTADKTETRAINFNGEGESNATALDPFGHTLTMEAAALTGSGAVTVNSNAAGETKGKVVFKGATSSFTGTLYINATNKDQIEFSPASAFTGNVRYTAAGALNSDLSGFTGTITFDGENAAGGREFDVRAINLSSATVILANGAVLNATAGQEGSVTVVSGTTLNLYVTDDTYKYDGYIFTGTNDSGAVKYSRPNASEGYDRIDDGTALNGNNLLPYFQIWSASTGTSGTLNTDADWSKGAVPSTERPADSGKTGNAAFKIAAGTTTTINVDENFAFGEIQVLKTGSGEGDTTVIFNSSVADKVLSANILTIGDGINVQVSGNKPLKIENGYIAGGSLLTVNASSTMEMDGVDCSTRVSVVGKLEMKGTSSLSYPTETQNAGNAVSGTLEIVNGTTTLYAGNRGLSGALTVNTGATLIGMTGDFPNYDDSSTINVYGTLTIGSEALNVRKAWTLKSSNALNLYAGATLNGYGSNIQGILDIYDLTIPVRTNPDNAALDTVTCSGQIRLMGNVTVNVADGITLKMPTKPWHGSNQKVIHKNGLGTFEMCDDNPSSDTMNVLAGQVISTVVPGYNVSIAEGATFTLKDCNWTSGNKFSGEGTLELDADANDRWYYSSSSFAGKVKVIRSGNGYPIVGGNGSEAPVFTAKPEMAFSGIVSLNGCFHNNILPVRDFSGDGEVNFKNAAEGTRTISTKQTKNTAYSGVFKRVAAGSTYCNTALTVYGDDGVVENVYALTLSGVNETSGALLVTNNAKVVFTSTGSWANGPVTVGAGGYLEMTNQTAVSTLTLNDGGTLCVDLANIPTVGALTLPASGMAYIKILNGTLAEDTVLFKATSGVAASDTPLATLDIEGRQSVLKAVLNGDYVEIRYTLARDDDWDTDAATWSADTFDSEETYRDGMDVRFSAITGVSEHTITLDGTRSPKNVTFGSGTTYTITGGTFAPTGTVTLEAGANVVIESVASGTYIVGEGATLSLANATVSSVSGTGTLDIPEGGTITISSINTLDSIAILTGKGTLVLPTANQPGADSALKTLLQKQDAEEKYYWCGTVVLSGGINSVNPNNCGNSGSKVKFLGVSNYLPESNVSVSVETVFENGTGGYAFSIGNGYNTAVTTFDKISGNGTIIDAHNNNNCEHAHVFKDATGFTGSIKKGTQTNATKRFIFSRSGSTTDASSGNITVQSDGYAVLGDGNEWSPGSSIVVNGTVEFKGAGIFSKGVTFGDGAVIKFDDLGTGENRKQLSISGAVSLPSGGSSAIVKVALDEDVVLPERGSLTLASWSSIASGIVFRFEDSSYDIRWSLVKGDDGLVMRENPRITADEDDSLAGFVFGNIAAVYDTPYDSVTVPEDVASSVNTIQLLGIRNRTIEINGVAANAVLLIGLNEDGSFSGAVSSGAYTSVKGDSKTTISLNAPSIPAAGVTVGGDTIPPISFASDSEGETVRFGVSGYAGLWYLVEYDDGTYTEAQQATSDGGLLLEAPLPATGSRIYKVHVGGCKAAMPVNVSEELEAGE